jgi:DNA-directed RNA polymerase sigma subunit (sigma70/sigma32)
MKIAAITRFKHGGLYQLLKKHNWSQAELARRAGISIHSVSCAINMHNRPSMATIDAIQKAFAEVGEFADVAEMFPDAYIGFGQSVKHLQFADLDQKQLEDFATHQQLLLEDAQAPLPEDSINSKEALEAFKDLLTEREQSMMSMRFVDNLTLEDVGRKHGCGKERVRQIIDIALSKIRYQMQSECTKSTVPDLKVKLFKGRDGIFRTEPPGQPDKDEDYVDWLLSH